MTVARAACPAADIRHIVFDFGAVVLQWKPTDVVKRHFPERCPDAAAAQAFARAVFAHGDWQQFDAGLADAPTTGARLAARLELDAQRVHDMVHCIDDHLQPIASSDFPSAAQRPFNSRLNSLKLAKTFDFMLPAWQCGVERALTEIFNK